VERSILGVSGPTADGGNPVAAIAGSDIDVKFLSVRVFAWFGKRWATFIFHDPNPAARIDNGSWNEKLAVAPAFLFPLIRRKFGFCHIDADFKQRVPTRTLVFVQRLV
jgi:hypothetical protein